MKRGFIVLARVCLGQLLLAAAGCSSGSSSTAPAAPAPLAPRYMLVGAKGARSFAEPGRGEPQALLPGFGISLVEEHAAGGQRWGRTGHDRWIAMSEIEPAHPASPTGVPLAGPPDFAWVVTAGAAVLDGPNGVRLGAEPLFARVSLPAPCDRAVCRTSRGWMRAEDLRAPHLAPPPAHVGPTDRWLDIELATQTLVAYEGPRPLFTTLVSTGIGAPGSALATPTGVFAIRSKHRAASMDNLEHTGVVPYSYEDIPLVQYFTDRVALHAALWHQRFGHPASHGCINLAPGDADRLFAFTSPRLLPGDSAIYARPGAPATIVRVR